MEQLGMGRRQPPPSPPHKHVQDLEPDQTWKSNFGQTDRLKLAQHMVSKLEAAYVGCDSAAIRSKVTRWEMQAFTSATSRNHYLKHIAERINEVQEQVQANTASAPSARPASIPPSSANNSIGAHRNGNNPNFTAPVGHPNFVPATSTPSPATVPAPSHNLPPSANLTNSRGRGRGRPRGRGRGRVSNAASGGGGAAVGGNLGTIVPNGGLMTPEVLLKLQQQQHLRQQQRGMLMQQQHQQQQQQRNAEVLRQQRLQQQQRAMMNGQAGGVNPYMTPGVATSAGMNGAAVRAQAQAQLNAAAVPGSNANREQVQQKLIEFCRRYKAVFDKIRVHMDSFFNALDETKRGMAKKKFAQIVIFFQAFQTNRVPHNLTIPHLQVGTHFMEMVINWFRSQTARNNAATATATATATAAAVANPNVVQQQQSMTQAQQRAVLLRQQQQRLRAQAAQAQVAHAQAAQAHAAQMQARVHAQAMQSRTPVTVHPQSQPQTRLVQPQQLSQQVSAMNAKPPKPTSAPTSNGVAVVNASGSAVKAQVAPKRALAGQLVNGKDMTKPKRQLSEKEVRLIKLNERSNALLKFSVKIAAHAENCAKRAEFEKKQKIERARSTLDMLGRLENRLIGEPRKRKAEDEPDALDGKENEQVIKANNTFECSADDGLVCNKNKRRKIGQKEGGGGRKTLYELVKADCEAARMQNDLVEYKVREEYGLPVVDCQLLIREIRMPRLMIQVQRGYPGTSSVTYGWELPPLGWVGAVKDARDEFRRAVHRAPANNIGVAALLDMWASVASAAVKEQPVA